MKEYDWNTTSGFYHISGNDLPYPGARKILCSHCGQPVPDPELWPAEYKVAGAVLAMPADYEVMYEMPEQDPAFKKVIMDLFADGAEWLKGTDAEALYREASEYSGNMKMKELYHYVDTVPILWIHALGDELFRPEMGLDSIMKQGGMIKRLDLETDHMASDRRCELTEITAEWLLKKCL